MEIIEAGKTLMDYIWVLLSAALVFLMQLGFMSLESGMARAKNSINIATKNLSDFILSVAGFWVIGFGLMFGESAGGILGTSHFFVDVSQSSWLAVFFVFQAVFVGTAATIDSGAVAERTKFTSYLFISFMTSAIIYPIFGHWAWGSFYLGGEPGWLEGLGFIDFAGSTVVHSIGAWVALAGVIIVGPRLGWIKAGKVRKIPPHNLIYVYLGTFILFFGWFGFNAGSTLGADESIGIITMNTILAAVMGAISTGALSWMFSEKNLPEPEMIANGVLAGLVGITAGCASVSPVGATIIGLVSGVIMYLGAWTLQKLKLDDVVGAIPVHGFAGAWGTLAVGFFITEDNLLAGGLSRLDQIGVQGLGVLVAFGWAFGLGLVFYLTMKFTLGVRVSPEEERIGLNVAEHGASSSLLELAESMRQVAESTDYKNVRPLAVEYGTEIGELTQFFNQMTNSLKQQQEDISIQQAKREKSMSRLRETLEEEKNLQKKLESIRSTEKDSMQKFSQQLDQMGTDVGEEIERMNRLIHGEEEFSEKLVGAFEHLIGRGEDLLLSYNTLVEGTKGLEEQIQDSVLRMKEAVRFSTDFTQLSNKISAIIDTIKETAESTHVLSINAAIEAARAGEHGNGFKVVSGEVKKLAEKSTSGTQSIVELLGGIQAISQDNEASIKAVEQVIHRIQDTHHMIEKELGEDSGKTRMITDTIKSLGQDLENIRRSFVELRESSNSIQGKFQENKNRFGSLLVES